MPHVHSHHLHNDFQHDKKPVASCKLTFSIDLAFSDENPSLWDPFPTKTFSLANLPMRTFTCKPFSMKKQKGHCLFRGDSVSKEKKQNRCLPTCYIKFLAPRVLARQCNSQKMVSGRCGANPRLALALCRHTHTEQMQNHPQFLAGHCVLRSQ